MNEIEIIESVISSFYSIISGRADEPRDWDRLLSLFVPGATVISSSMATSPKGPATAVAFSEYANKLASVLAKSDFFETVSVQRIEVFDLIAQAVCIYEARQSPTDPEPTRRGVHYVHLVRIKENWRIAGMIWLDAADERPMPREYLS